MSQAANQKLAAVEQPLRLARVPNSLRKPDNSEDDAKAENRDCR